MHQLAVLVVLAVPEAVHDAGLADLLPFVHVQMAVLVERRHEFVAVLLAALGKFLGAGQFQADLLSGMGVGLSSFVESVL